MVKTRLRSLKSRKFPEVPIDKHNHTVHQDRLIVNLAGGAAALEKYRESARVTSLKCLHLILIQRGGSKAIIMKTFTAIIEKCRDTGLYVGYVPGFPGAHSQAESLDELKRNLQEVIEMLIEGGEPSQEAEFVGTQVVMVA